MSRNAIGLKQARCTNKRILLSANRLRIAVLSSGLVHDYPFFHAQQHSHLMGFPTSSFFTPCKHLIRRGWIDAVLTSERLN